MKNIYRTVLEKIHSKSEIALATVINTTGSTPQKAGSSALFGAKGLLSGTVGGGMVEDEIQHIAKKALTTGHSDHYYFNLDSEKGSEGAICGGESIVLVDANPSLHLSCFEDLEQSLLKRKEGFLLTMVMQEADQPGFIRRHWIQGSKAEYLPGDMAPEVKDSISSHLKDAAENGFSYLNLKSHPNHQVKMIFLEYIKPLPHLVIAGGGHIGKALAHLGSILEFEVSVMDDRPEFASKDHIPDADHHIVGELGKSIGRLNPGSDTYIVIVTRGHLQDAEALRACIGSKAAYIGMIGSRHKVGTVKNQFLNEGWATPEQWASIHSPIGLSIGSKTVQEIAISIAAQLVEVRSNKKSSHGR